VRLHIDACGSANGPFRVVPGSHLGGRLAEESVTSARTDRSEEVCLVPRGGALVMKPLLLHASSKATAPNRRRVLHFLFGPRNLPFGLRYAYAV
jgi:ectoine hydroxylase-related dioxygenase (phytanoyl-CoA dioxygenase family)